MSDNDAIQSPEFMQKGFVRHINVENGDRPRPQQPNRPPVGGGRYSRYIPWDLRLHRRLRTWWIWPKDLREGNQSGAWFRRFRVWVFGLRSPKYGQYEMARDFFVAITGGLVSKEEAQQRMRVCHQCPNLRVQLPKKVTGKAKLYCGSCQCVNWALSELHAKNGFRRWYCPEKRHAGFYPGAWLERFVIEHEEIMKHGSG